jgi:hypothetical protein
MSADQTGSFSAARCMRARYIVEAESIFALDLYSS